MDVFERCCGQLDTGNPPYSIPSYSWPDPDRLVLLDQSTGSGHSCS
ncbi:hypothetical protein BZL29_8192 [Mycobacterium kansasii]|uniref:Uncharacterized protein n=1 Tax=Mycobacterium kansasii TaxID=1768 RepID=A0A1V3WBE8_MYCKA|nr:hypothetical protein BZL29_8192 [Mycobacterium kansasii]